MLLQALTLIHHITTMLFGIFLSAFFLGAKQDRKNILLLLSTGAISGLLYYPVVLALGTSWADPIYPCWYTCPFSCYWYFIISTGGCLRWSRS